jgi:predicted O-methyltransferase YrrM
MQIRIICLPIFTGMLFQFIADYLKHRLTAKSRHGTHSPFVYKLVDEVIYDFSGKKVYHDIEKQRKKLSHDDTSLFITAAKGAPGRQTSRQKKVSDLAKNTSRKVNLAQLIYRLAKNHGGQKIIELGTGLGMTTAYLAKANPAASIVTIEHDPETAKIAYQNFIELELTNIELQVGDVNELLQKELENTSRLDLVYIDAGYTKQAALHYFHRCLPKSDEHTLLLFAGIYWNKGMKEAWEEIKQHPQVTVTIDLFWIGLVYFRKGQVKEHFKIKF